MNRKSYVQWFLLLALLVSIPVVHGQPISDKTLFIFLRVTGQAVHVDNAMLKEGRFRDARRQGSYRYTLLSQDNQELYTGRFPDPLVRIEEDFTGPEHPRGGEKRLEENEIHLTIPYLPEAKRIRFERQAGDQWVSMGVSPLPDTKE
jgi:hypothetical protein